MSLHVHVRVSQIAEYPTADELWIAWRAIHKMHRNFFRDKDTHGKEWMKDWGGWGEAQLSCALAASFLSEREGDEYDTVWHRMMDDDE